LVKAFSRFEVVNLPEGYDDVSDYVPPTSPAAQADVHADPQEQGLFWVAVSTGEAVDKLTILSIKKDKIKDPNKLQNIRKESSLLAASIERAMGRAWLEHELVHQLTEVNRRLWEVEDDVRRCEANKDFGAEFVQLARSVYRLNDERGRLKRQISRLSSSGLVEEKQYTTY
jgi:hypothetical protein